MALASKEKWVPNRNSRRGFTLIEVLLALMIAGLLLTAVSFLVVTMAQIWINRGDDDFFDQHVDGVTLFLNNALLLSEGLEENATEVVSWSRPPGYSEFEDPLIAFTMKESPALLSFEDRPLSAITCYLFFRGDDEGLSILWHSELQEIEDIDDVFRSSVSLFVSSIEYNYYDLEEEEWSTESEPKEDDEGLLILPDFLTLQFEHDGEIRRRPVYLPQRTQNVPLF